MYCEVALSYLSEQWKDMHVPSPFEMEQPNDDAAQSTLTEFGGSTPYTLKISDDNISNRSLVWKVQGSVLELTEVSFDSALHENSLRLTFPAAILPSVCVFDNLHHTNDPSLSIIVLTTAKSLHKIVIKPSTTFPSTSAMVSMSSVPSLLYLLTQQFENRQTSYALTELMPSLSSREFQVMQAINSECVVVGSSNGSLLYIQMLPDNLAMFELAQTSPVARLSSTFWSLTSRLVSRANMQQGVIAIETVLLHNDALLFTLCADCKLRVWSVQQRVCIQTYDLSTACLSPSGVDAATIITFNGFRSMRITPVQHNENASLSFDIVVFMREESEDNSSRAQFHCISAQLLSPDILDSQRKLVLLPASSKLAPMQELVDFSVLNGNLWSLWQQKVEFDFPEGSGIEPAYAYYVQYGPILRNSSVEVGLESVARAAPWTESSTIYSELEAFFPKGELTTVITNELRDALLNRMFEAGSFSGDVIYNSLHIINNQLAPAPREEAISEYELRELVVQVVEAEAEQLLQSSNTNEESALFAAWQKLWFLCLNLWLHEHKPLGIGAVSTDHCITVITQDSMHLVRPCDPIETLYNRTEATLPSISSRRSFVQLAPSVRDYAKTQAQIDSVIHLVDCISFVAQQLGDGLIASFESTLSNLEDPQTAATPFVHLLISGSTTPNTELPITDQQSHNLRNFVVQFTRRFRKIGNASDAIYTLLMLLDIQQSLADVIGANTGVQYPSFTGSGLLLSEQQRLFSDWGRNISESALTATSQETGLLVCRIATQLIQTRFRLARDFTLFLVLVKHLRMSVLGFDASVAQSFRKLLEAEFLYRAAAALKMYSVLQWLAVSTPFTATTPILGSGNSSSYLQQQQQQQQALIPYGDFDAADALSNLTLGEGNIIPRANTHKNVLEAVFSINESERNYTRAIQMMYRSHNRGSQQLQQPLSNAFTSSMGHILTFLALKTIEFLWCTDNESKTRTLDTCSVMQRHSQYTILQEYVRLNADDVPHLHHYRALCYLHNGHVLKAKDSFLYAAIEIANPEKTVITQRLFDLLLESEEASGLSESLRTLATNQHQQPQRSDCALFFYYNYLRKLCERQNPDLLIDFARLALTIAPEDATQEDLSILWSQISSFSLNLERYTDAYEAIVSNPDPKRQYEDLRWFVSVLCDKNPPQLALLNELPYVGKLATAVTDILMHKAKHSDVIGCYLPKQQQQQQQQQFGVNIYNVLYSFFVFRSDYKRAAMVMHELAQRLSKESGNTTQFLERQAMCLLAAINALNLVDPKYAWIVYRSDSAESPNAQTAASNAIAPMSPTTARKRSRSDTNSNVGMVDGQRTGAEESATGTQPTIISIEDLQRQYLLTLARIQLARLHSGTNSDQTSASIAGAGLSAADLVILLVEAGIFDTALTLAEAFSLEKRIIFEHLAAQCIRVQLHALNTSEFIFTIEEDISGHSTQQRQLNSSQALNTNELSQNQGWKLLEFYLRKYDARETNYQYHCIAIDKIFSIDRRVKLPNWLIRPLKSKNPAALLRAYMKYELLEDAATLVLDYLTWLTQHPNSHHRANDRHGNDAANRFNDTTDDFDMDADSDDNDDDDDDVSGFNDVSDESEDEESDDFFSSERHRRRSHRQQPNAELSSGQFESGALIPFPLVETLQRIIEKLLQQQQQLPREFAQRLDALQRQLQSKLDAYLQSVSAETNERLQSDEHTVEFQHPRPTRNTLLIY